MQFSTGPDVVPVKHLDMGMKSYLIWDGMESKEVSAGCGLKFQLDNKQNTARVSILH